ncbi:MAG: biphenyl 2,3-dioxygenase [Nevskia sp.]|nr:biphenyl 2,3-dioxygenase [Nevskia sp.]
MVKIQALSYVVAQSTDVSRWRQFGEQVLGTQTADAPDAGLYLKMDERQFRLAVVKGGEDRYLVSGWEVADAAAFKSAVETLQQAGVKLQDGDAALCKARCVKALVKFADPAGNQHELGWGYDGGSVPFKSPVGVRSFKTGKYGVGHTVLPALPFDETLKFYREVLGFGLSDVFNFQPAPDAPVIRLYFLHAASGRHHSVALAEMPSPSGCVHIMVEVEDQAEVDRAELRREKNGAKLMATLGQHENDKMTSFYLLTPGNFALEYGWGGISVDPATWQTTYTKQVSIWGHDFSVGFS